MKEIEFFNRLRSILIMQSVGICFLVLNNVIVTVEVARFKGFNEEKEIC